MDTRSRKRLRIKEMFFNIIISCCYVKQANAAINQLSSVDWTTTTGSKVSAYTQLLIKDPTKTDVPFQAGYSVDELTKDDPESVPAVFTFKNTHKLTVEWSVKQLDLKYPVRSVMVLINQQLLKSMLGGETDTLSLVIRKSEFCSISKSLTPGKNFVLNLNDPTFMQKDSDSIDFLLSLQALGTSDVYVEIQKLYAIREWSLNTLLFETYYAQIDYYSTKQNYDLRTPIDGESIAYQNPLLFDYKMYNFGVDFSNDDSSCISATSFDVFVLSHQDPLTSGVKENVIISSVFLQMGVPYDPLDNFKVVIDTRVFDYELTKQWIDGVSTIVLYDSEYDGAFAGQVNYFFDVKNSKPPTEPVFLKSIVVNFNKHTSGTPPTYPRQICTMQLFGWSFCQVGTFKTVDSIKINPAYQTDVKIGYFTAYYDLDDPDYPKEHNPFCSQGFIGDIDSPNAGILKYNRGDKDPSDVTDLYFSQYFIDFYTLEITIYKEQFGVPTDSPPQKVQYSFQLCNDRRDLVSQKDCKPSETFVYLDKFCGYEQITYGEQLTDQIQLITPIEVAFPKPNGIDIQYAYGSGVNIIDVIVKSECVGFIKGWLKEIFAYRTEIQVSSTLNDFQRCSQYTTQQSNSVELCAYFDSDKQQIYLFWHPESLSTQFNLHLGLFFFNYYNTVDEQQQNSKYVQGLYINLLKPNECFTTSLAPQNLDQFPLKIEILQGELYQQQIQIPFKDSYAIKQNYELICGEKQFTIIAKNDQKDYEVAQTLLNNCEGIQYVCVRQLDNFNMILDLQLQIVQPVTLFFEIIASLKYYPNTETSLEVVVDILSTKSEIQFFALEESVDIDYYVGIKNPPLDLSQFYYVPQPYRVAWFSAEQTLGTLPQEEYQVVNSTLNFSLNITDLTYANRKSVFRICAYLNENQFDCSLVITVNFLLATQVQKKSQNTQPVFQDRITQPDPLPCLGFDEASKWSYSFPRVVDAQYDSISQSLECGTTNIFTTSEHNNILSVQLKTKENDLSTQNVLCQIILSDTHGASKSYSIVFKNQCFILMQDKAFKFKRPAPQIRNISTSGQVLINWNVELKMPSSSQNDTRNLQSMSLDCAMSSLAINVTKGKGSVFERNLNFTQSVSKFSRTTTEIKIDFFQPGDISTEAEPDQLFISFLNQSCYTSVFGFQVNSSDVLSYKIPRQKTKGVFEFSDPTNNFVQFATNVSLFVLVMNFFLKGFLNSLLSSIESLGILFHMFLVTLNYPVELLNFFNLLFPLVTFDAIPTEKLYEKMFHLSQIQTDHALTDQFDSSGYSSIFIVNNIGSLFLVTVIQSGICIFLWLNRRYKFLRRLWFIQDKLDQIANDTFWNGIIGFYAGNYLLFGVVSFIESKNLRFGSFYTATENFCSVLSVLGMILAFLFLVSIVILYREKTHQIDPATKQFDQLMQQELGQEPVTKKKQSRTEAKDHELFIKILQSETHQKFIETYGTLIDGLRLNRLRRNITLITPINDLLMKLLISVSVTRLVHWPVFTIFVFNFAILFSTEFVFYYSPQQDKFERVRAKFNAVSYLVLNYHLFLFTRYTDQSMFPHVANSVIVLMWFCIGINLALTFPIQMIRYVMSLRLQYKRFKHMKYIQSRDKIKFQRQTQKQLQQFQKQQQQIQAGVDNVIENERKVRSEQVVRQRSNSALVNQIGINQSLDILLPISERSENSSGTISTYRDQVQQYQFKPDQIEEQVTQKISDTLTQTVNVLEKESIVDFLQNYQQPKLKEQARKKKVQPKQANQNQVIENSISVARQIQFDPDRIGPLAKQYEDDFYPGDFYKATPSYFAYQLKVGVPDESVRLVDSRNLSIKETLLRLQLMVAPLDWLNFQHGKNSANTIDNSSEQTSQTLYKTILTTSTILTNNKITVKEYFGNPGRRTFRFYIENQLEASFSEQLDRNNDDELFEKIEYLVKRMQLGVTPKTYISAINEEVDLKLEWYANACKNLKYQDQYGNDWQLEPDNTLFTGEFKMSLTLVQKLCLYEHVMKWIDCERSKWEDRNLQQFELLMGQLLSSRT